MNQNPKQSLLEEKRTNDAGATSTESLNTTRHNLNYCFYTFCTFYENLDNFKYFVRFPPLIICKNLKSNVAGKLRKVDVCLGMVCLYAPI